MRGFTDAVFGTSAIPDDGTFLLIVNVHGCAAGTDTLTVTLRSGSTDVAASSRSITVTDPPRNLRANGDSTGFTAGRAVVRWDGENPAQTYKVRYARECINPDDDQGIGPCSPLPQTWTTPASATSTDNSVTIQQLALETLYRVQVKEVARGYESDWSDPVFVYPTDAQTSRADTVATVDYDYYWPDGTYEFTICASTFSASTTEQNKWITDIVAGIERWENAVRWDTGSGDNIIQVSRVTTGNCAESHDYLNSVVKMYAQDKLNTQCSFPPDSTVGGCRIPANQTQTGSVQPSPAATILISSGYAWQPGTILTGDPGVTSNCSAAEWIVVHEAGHALGVRDHSTIDTQIMEAEHHRYRCDLQPYDIAAIMALYQSE